LSDPKLTILALIKGGWNLPTTPNFSADWVQEKASFPQVIVSHLVTSPRPTGFSENQASADRRMEGVYAVEVWSKDASERWDLLRPRRRPGAHGMLIVDKHGLRGHAPHSFP